MPPQDVIEKDTINKNVCTCVNVDFFCLFGFFFFFFFFFFLGGGGVMHFLCGRSQTRL